MVTTEAVGVQQEHEPDVGEILRDIYAELGRESPGDVPQIDAVFASEVLRQLGVIDREQDLYEQTARAEIARLQARLDRRRAVLAGRRDQLLAMVRAWVEQTASELKKRSVVLANGKFQLRKRPLGLEITNEDELRAWAAENCPALLVPQEPRLDRRGLNDAFAKGGEIPPGTEPRGGDDALSYEVA